MQNQVIYTEKNNCQDCYKCVKQCPVKCIKIEDNSASVINKLCLYCGRCILSCPVKAKKYRKEIQKVQWMVDSGERVIASVAPSYLADFGNITPQQFMLALEKLGFHAVSETGSAAEIVAQESLKWLQEQPSGVYFSTCCPAVVNYIGIYAPDLLPGMVPVVSPMVAHARQIKDTFGKEVKVVFIGPCIAKKQESDQMTDAVDAVLTFQELQEWMDDEQINPSSLTGNLKDNFLFGLAGKGNLFPVDGGMISNMKNDVSITEVSFMTFSGMNNIREIVNDIPGWENNGKLFLELMACEGGCIKGPGSVSKRGIVSKRSKLVSGYQTLKDLKLESSVLTTGAINYNRQFENFQQAISCVHSEEEVQALLNSMGKLSEKEELNCSGCGYDNCREFTRALLDGKAERTMCISYMRHVAQDKASVLLRKIPYGVVMVDEHLKLLDCNQKFAEMLGPDISLIFESNPGMAGADLKKLVPYHKLFTNLLQSGEEIVEQDIRDQGNYLHVSVISIQKYKLAYGIIQNLREPEIHKEIMVQRIREVLKQNMESVQRIAYLLGENASFTESMLNTIVESSPTNEGSSK